MWSVTHSLSSRRSPRTVKRIAVVLFGVFAFAVVPSVSFASLITTDIFIVTEEDVVDEDVYVTSTRGAVEGTIDGDLTIFTGDLVISGDVTGSVTVFSSGSVVVEQTGTIQGSLRGASVNVTIEGEVRGDVFMTAASLVVTDTGSVGRDAMLFGGTGRVEGSVARDVRGRTLRLVIDGAVGGDVDVATQKLEFGPDAEVGGDVLYRSPRGASGIESVAIAGTLTRLPAQSNFVYGIILTLANVVGFFGFLLAGITFLWLVRATGARATGSVLTHPIKSLAVGIAAVIILPVAVVLVALTLVGIPIAILLLLAAVAMFIVGPVPSVSALGNLVLVRRGGLFGAFLMGALLWRLGIWIVPVVGGLIYLLGLVWGIGGWILGALASRNARSGGSERQNAGETGLG